MTSPVILVAASGLAREVAESMRASGREVIGVVDDNPALTDAVLDGWLRVLGGLEVVAGTEHASVLLCAGKGAVRADLAQRMAAMGIGPGRYATHIDPSVTVPATCSVGAGSVLLAGTVLTAAVEVGTHVVCMPNVTLTHDDVVEDFATLCAGVTLGGSVRVGREAYLGMSASVREGVSVGAGAVLGMGAVLVCDQAPGEVWVGLPARPIGERVAPWTTLHTQPG